MNYIARINCIANGIVRSKAYVLASSIANGITNANTNVIYKDNVTSIVNDIANSIANGKVIAPSYLKVND